MYQTFAKPVLLGSDEAWAPDGFIQISVARGPIFRSGHQAKRSGLTRLRHGLVKAGLRRLYNRLYLRIAGRKGRSRKHTGRYTPEAPKKTARQKHLYLWTSRKT